MNQTAVRIAALVLTYQRPDSLQRLLRSLVAQDLLEGSEAQMFIWNNDPEANWDELAISELEASGWRIHRHIASENLKMRAKRSLEDWCFEQDDAFDVIIHLDDDVVLEPGWILAGLDALNAGFDACGSVEHFRGELVCSGQTELYLSTSSNGVTQWEWKWERVNSDFGIRPARFAGHRAMMIRADIAKHALHDPDIRIGGEDLDYSLALERAGARIAISQHALIRHRSADEEDAPAFRNYEDVTASWQLFHAKWGFVRRNAASEAGLSEEAWMDLFRKAQD